MADDDNTGAETVPKSVMLKRLASKDEKIAQLEASHAELKAQVAAAPDLGKLEKRYQRLQEKHEALEQEHGQYQAEVATREILYQSEITDPDDMDMVRYRHGKLGDGAPELADWLQKGAADDKFVSALLGGDEGGADDKDAGDTKQTKRQPANRTNGVKNDTQRSGHMSLEAISQMTVAERLSPEGRAAIAAALAETP